MMFEIRREIRRANLAKDERVAGGFATWDEAYKNLQFYDTESFGIYYYITVVG